MNDAAHQPTLIEKLWDRKFPQYFGSYLAVGFGLLQFLEFMVNRYAISPNYIDKYLILWLLSIPAVGVLIYYKGRLPRTGGRGRRSWQRWLVPLNLGLSLVLAVMLFGGGEAQAAAEIISATNEKGERVRAVVPDQNTVKYLSIFRFSNQTGEDGLDWWGTAFSYLLSVDLRQRPEFYPTEARELSMLYNEFGFEPFDEIGIGTQRRVAQRARTEYFISGSYSQDEAGTYLLEGTVQRTRDGKKLFTIEARDSDPFAAVEQISDQISDGLPNPLQNDELESDLPVASLITGNETALKELILASDYIQQNPQDFAGTLAIARRSYAADPSCSVCAFSVGNSLLGLGKRDSALLLTQQAVRLATSLPKREQLGMRSILYMTTGDLDKYYDLQEMARRLYPYDYSSYAVLVGYYQGTKGLDSAIVLMQEAVDNGHRERGLLALADLRLEKKDYDEAERVLDRFFELYPERTEDRLRYVMLYERRNQPERARQVLEEMITLEPLNLTYQFRLADMQYRQGKYENALFRYQDLLEEATTQQDSFQAFRSIARVYRRQGKIKSALGAYDQLEQAMIRVYPYPNVVSLLFQDRDYCYSSVGREAAVDSMVAIIDRYLPEVAEILACMHFRTLLTEGWGDENLGEKVENCKEAALRQGMTEESYEFYLTFAKSDYSEAAQLLAKAEETGQQLTPNEEFQAEVYLRAGELDRAEKIVREQLLINPDYPYYLVQLHRITGEVAPLERALEIWKDADAEFIPARKAQELSGQS